MTTVNIPLTTLAPGTYHFGPATVADTDSRIVITNDRTVTGGMNSQTSATTLTLQSEQSNNGGATWQVLAVSIIQGGTWSYTKPGVSGQLVTTDNILTELNPGTSRQVRATVTVAGASVAVQGTLTTS